MRYNRLVVVFLVLLVIIVGLVAGIVFLKNNSDDGNVSCKLLNDDSQVYDYAVCAEGIKDNGGTSKEIIEMYNDSIKNAKANGDYDLAAKLSTQQISDLVLMNDCDEAMRLIRDGDYEEYDSRLLGLIYSYGLSASIECNDDEMQKELSDALAEIQKEDNGGIGF